MYGLPNQGRRKFLLKPSLLPPPPTIPQLFYRATAEEPPEITAFQKALTERPGVLRLAITAQTHLTTETSAEIGDLARTIAVLVASSHWEGQPAGLAVDQTTENQYFANHPAMVDRVGKAEKGSAAHLAAIRDLRLGMLCTLAQRAEQAVQIDSDRKAGIIFRDPNLQP